MYIVSLLRFVERYFCMLFALLYHFCVFVKVLVHFDQQIIRLVFVMVRILLLCTTIIHILILTHYYMLYHTVQKYVARMSCVTVPILTLPLVFDCSFSSAIRFRWVVRTSEMIGICYRSYLFCDGGSTENSSNL